MQKFSLRVLHSFCLFFCKFRPGVAHESATYKKASRNGTLAGKRLIKTPAQHIKSEILLIIFSMQLLADSKVHN